MKVTILDHEFDYRIGQDELEGKWGRSNAKEGWIAISSKCPVDQRNSTIMHEVVHIASDLLDAGIGEHENKVSAVGCALHSFIKNNRDFIDELYKK